MIQAVVMCLDFRKETWTSHTQLVAIALADRVNGDTLECWPSIADIARRVNLDKRTVQRHIRTLEADGTITRLGQRLGKAGRPTSNVWRWNLLITMGGVTPLSPLG